MLAPQILNFINGEFVATGKWFDNRTPTTNAVIGQVAEAGKAEVDAAVAAARAALKGPWGSMPLAKRVELLEALVAEITRRFDEFLEAECADTGKPMSLASHIDIPRGAANFKVFADVVKNVPTEFFEMATPDGRGAINYGYRKPVGVVAGSWLVTRLSRRRLRPAVGWAAVLGAGTVSGVGFTISLLIAAIAFEGPALEQAKIGIVAAAVVASLVTWLVFRVTALLPTRRRARALLGDVADLVDLVEPVDPERDHVRGPAHSPVTVVEYGDFQCPYCGQAEPFVRQLLADELDVRYVWRHLPLRDVHPRAQLAAEAAEAASDQGAFWEMHDLLLDRQEALKPEDLLD